jgi:hypothetical protein
MIHFNSQNPTLEPYPVGYNRQNRQRRLQQHDEEDIENQGMVFDIFVF